MGRVVRAVAVGLLLVGCRGGGESHGRGAAPLGAPGAADPCLGEGLESVTGAVVAVEGGYALRAGDRLVPVYEISQAEAVSPRSPDLSADLGREITLCGRSDGAALYEARRPGPRAAAGAASTRTTTDRQISP